MKKYNQTLLIQDQKTKIQSYLPGCELKHLNNCIHSSQVAKKFVDGKKTMAASGRLINTPFVDEVWN